MNRKALRSLSVPFLASLLVILAFGSLTLPARSQGGKPAPSQTDARLDAVRHGKWPAQIAAHSGSIQPDRHGPQRTDPAEGIPQHAYSPFDERVNRDYPCPPGGCEFEKGRVLVKLAPQVPDGTQLWVSVCEYSTIESLKRPSRESLIRS